MTVWVSQHLTDSSLATDNVCGQDLGLIQRDGCKIVSGHVKGRTQLHDTAARNLKYHKR